MFYAKEINEIIYQYAEETHQGELLYHYIPGDDKLYVFTDNPGILIGIGGETKDKYTKLLNDAIDDINESRKQLSEVYSLFREDYNFGPFPHVNIVIVECLRTY